MSDDEVQFPNRMPSDAQQTWADYYSVAQNSSASDPFPEALKVLHRLATSRYMEDAWTELKNFPDVSPNDLMGMTFMVWLLATYNRLLRKYPHFKSDRDERELASKIRVVTDALRDPAIRGEASITDPTLRELERAAAIYEQRAKNADVLLRIAPPPKKAGLHNADEIAFIDEMCDGLVRRQTGRRKPYILVAILVNVVFNVSAKKLWDADKVKHCFYSRGPGKSRVRAQVREH